MKTKAEQEAEELKRIHKNVLAYVKTQQDAGLAVSELLLRYIDKIKMEGRGAIPLD